MPTTFTQPDGLPVVDLYHQVSVATGHRLVHLAGQVAWDADGRLVGEGDLAAQVEQCFRNVALALAAVGGTFADVVDLTAYVVDWTPARMGALVEGMQRGAEAVGGSPAPPSTLIGVAALDVPEHLVELKVVAVLD